MTYYLHNISFLVDLPNQTKLSGIYYQTGWKVGVAKGLNILPKRDRWYFHQ